MLVPQEGRRQRRQGHGGGHRGGHTPHQPDGLREQYAAVVVGRSAALRGSGENWGIDSPVNLILELRIVNFLPSVALNNGASGASLFCSDALP